MPQKKVYAVAKGRKPGIYFNWPDAKSQVEGFTGAVYKGFASIQEAEEWLENRVFSHAKSSHNKNKSDYYRSIDSDKNRINKSFEKTSELSREMITIYSDGGSSGNPGPGGYGVVIIDNDERRELSGGFRLTTNNRMELTGVIVALKNLTRKDIPISVYTDSSYVVNGITKGWAKGWRKNNWIKSDKTPAMNPDLWSELLDLIEPLKVTFHWVKGHAGNPLNERCDELAVTSAKGKNLPPDKGYKG